jgi:hypothetical protein
MTRSSLRSTLRRSYWLLALVLAISLATKLAEHIPGIAGGPLEKLATDIYEYLKDMALVFVTVVAAYLASVFQKRHSFIEALREEWRDIIKAKSALFAYTQIEKPTQRDYVAAFCAISETIDNMRSVYKNVGETNRLVGLYPYEPLHDMRRALQTLSRARTRTLVRRSAVSCATPCCADGTPYVSVSWKSWIWSHRTIRFSFPALSGPSRPAQRAWRGPRWRPNAGSK